MDNGWNDNGYKNNNNENNDNQYGQGQDPQDYAFRTVMRNGKPKTMGWSVASLVLGIISVVCCCFGYASLILGVLAIVFSVLSRKALGYFDGLSIAGLILGIFGLVFGLAVVIGALLVPEELLEDYLEQYYGESNIPNNGNF